MNCYTYMVQCSDGTLYTGWTNDLKKRLENTMPAKVLAIHVGVCRLNQFIMKFLPQKAKL